MRTIWTGVLTAISLMALRGIGHAGPHHELDCTDAGLRRARRAADALVADKDYPAAIAMLRPLNESCPTTSLHGTVTIEAGWLRSDLAFAYERNHDYEACIQLADSVGVWEEDGRSSDKLFKALSHNLDRCERGLEAKHALQQGSCALAVDGAIATAPASRALMPPGATAACVALLAGEQPAAATVDAIICPTVALIWKGTGGAIERKRLPFEGGALENDVLCRSLSSIAAGALAGKAVIRVRGEPHDCNGCKNVNSIDVFYAWAGKVLSPTLDLTD